MKHSTYLIALILAAVAPTAMSGCKENEARADGSTESQKKASQNVSSNDKKADPSPNQNATRPVNVKVETVIPSSLTEYIVANGTTQAIRELTYSAEVPGRIEALSVDVGDRVRKGQILARIDFATLQAQAEQAQTSFNLAKSTYERFSKLQDEDIISRQRIDEAQSSMESAAAGVSIAEANVKKAVVRSTYSGIVGAKFAEKGEYVGPGTPLFNVVDYKTILVEARLAETQVAGIDKNAEVNVEIDALRTSYKGKVDTLIPAADKESKTFTLRIKVENPNYDILIGMSATVKLTAAERKDVIVVSQSAIIEERNERSVFVVNGDKAERRMVRIGAAQRDKVEVKEGLAAGDRLVVVGQRELEDGKSIRIVE